MNSRAHQIRGRVPAKPARAAGSERMVRTVVVPVSAALRLDSRIEAVRAVE